MPEAKEMRPGLIMCVCTGKCPGFETAYHSRSARKSFVCFFIFNYDIDSIL